MFYRPEFCCSCGEKIERADWKLWTSRRFCDLCATDHQLAEIVPKGLAAISIFVGILGIGRFLQSAPVSIPPLAKRPVVSQVNPQPVQGSPNFKTTETQADQSQTSSPGVNANAAKTETASVAKAESVVKPENIYFCGAETKKGTPCTRKVKGNVRCWQHQGMPAMLPPKKLLISK